MTEYLQMLCTLLHRNYNEAIDLEITFQEWSKIDSLSDFMKFLQKLADAGEWPKEDNGTTAMPRKVLERTVEDENYYDNLGLALMLSRICARMERLEQEAKNDVH